MVGHVAFKPQPLDLEDGVYQVSVSYLTAGFVVKDKQLIGCAPILRNKIGNWLKKARKIGDI